MAITKTKTGSKTELEATCDVCSKKLNTFTQDFKQATSFMRKNGWFMRKLGEKDWRHVCGRDCLGALEKRF